MKGCLIPAAILTFAFMVFCAGAAAVFIAKMPKPTTAERTAVRKETDEYMRLKMYERLVKEFCSEHLKSPATARYSLNSSFKNSELVITGHVDSQNGFGAMVRSKIHVLYVGEKDLELKFFKLGEKILVDQLTTTR